MKNSFSIGEISELLGIPKSTLRYWESVGLIDMPRELNNYRMYYPNSMYTISDLAHFRCLRMPLREMKRLPYLMPNELEKSLETLNQSIDDKVKELNIAKEYINRKMLYIKEYKKLCDNPYQQENPDYDNIYLFSIDDTEAWNIYIKDQYQSILLHNKENNSIVAGLTIPTTDNPKKLWIRDESALYLSFVLKVSYSNPSTEDFQPHIEYLERAGYRITNIFARYLFSACDEKYYDYYKAFAEVYQQ